MNFYIARILKNKAKYITMAVIIGFIYYAVNALSSMLPEIYETVNPSYAFDIDNIYELETLQNNRSILGLESNFDNKITFDKELLRELENIDGVHSVCLVENFSPRIKVYGGTQLNDSIKNCAFYSLGTGFDKVLNIDINRNDGQGAIYPEIIIETSLEDKIRELGLNKSELEIDKEKNKFSVVGTIEPLGIESNRLGNLYIGIKRISKAKKVLVRLTNDANTEKVEASIFYLLSTMYEADKSAFNFYPYKIYGLDDWFEMKNQILSFLIIAIILLFYIMLALLGLYWNETKGRKAEIGLLRAIGFNKKQIFLLFIKEASLVSIVAIILATIVIVNIYPSDLRLPVRFIKNVIINSDFVLSFVWISILIPALKATYINPAEVLSDE